MLKGLFAFSAVGAMALTGCSKEPADSSAPAANGAAADVASPSDVPAAFADLSVEDRAAALAQKICPVSGGPLGEMGTPIKVDVNGRDVFICCESCQEPLLKDPDKYLAKLDIE
jgi:YHS domain-containing protein